MGTRFRPRLFPPHPLPDRPVHSSASDRPLDPDVIATLKALGGDDDPDLFSDLVSMFMGDTPPRLQAIAEAIEAGDADSLEKVAHALKSSCGNLGATVLSELCREIEMAGRNGDVESARGLIDLTRTQYERVREALLAEVD